MTRARELGNLGSNTTGLEAINAVYDAGGLTGRNLIINGAMQVAQRSTSTASITTSAYHTIDRWFTSLVTLGTWTQSQSTDVPSGQGFASSLKMACTTADASPAAGDRLLIRQVLEGQDVQQLKKGTANAESVTLSFWVKSSKTGTHIVEIYDQDNARNIAKAYTVSSANTWEKKELTFAGDTTGVFDNDNASSFVLNMYLGAGSTYTSGTLATSWESATSANRAVGQVNLADSTSNEWYITGVQLEVGETATPFEHRSYGDELARCQRYLYMLDATSSAGDENTPVFREGATAAQLTYYLPTNLRATPSIVGSNYGRVVGYNTSFSVAAVAVSAMAVRTNINDGQKIDINLTHASLAGSYVFGHHDRTGESGTLYFEAEL